MSPRTSLQRACPCGSGTTYDACCGRLHRGSAQAETPEELMRARYSGYAVGERAGLGYVLATWHPRTRPDDLHDDPDLLWTGLRVLGSGEEEAGGWVEFEASFARGGVPGVLREHSTFTRRGGRWVYLDATTDSTGS